MTDYQPVAPVPHPNRKFNVKTFLIRLLVTAVAIFFTVQLLPGLHFNGTLLQLGGVALVFGLVNALLGPLLVILTCPLIILTLGLFTLAVNAVLLMITARVSTWIGFDFRIDGFWWAMLGGILIGIIASALTLLIHDVD